MNSSSTCVRAMGRKFFDARVAKLVDAPGLGPDVRKDVRVRVPPRAPSIQWATATLMWPK